MTAAPFDHNLSPCFMASTGAAMMEQSPHFLASPRALTSTHQWMDQPAAIQSKVYKRATAAINFLLLGVLMSPDGCSLSGSLRCSSTAVFKKSHWPDPHQWGRERGCCQEKIRWRDSGGWWDDIMGLDSNSSAWQQSRSGASIRCWMSSEYSSDRKGNGARGADRYGRKQSGGCFIRTQWTCVAANKTSV